MDDHFSSPSSWQSLIEERLRNHAAIDGAHDIGHLRRVLSMARAIALSEGAHDADVLTAAALLHDLVSLPKNHRERSRASRLAASAAKELLMEISFPISKVEAVGHAIEAHSYSAGIEPETPEARAVQDADRLDALGYIGIARCFAVGGSLGRALFDPEDPLAERRDLDEGRWAFDHFQTKLLTLPRTMTTAAGRAIGEERAALLRSFMDGIAAEAAPPRAGGLREGGGYEPISRHGSDGTRRRL